MKSRFFTAKDSEGILRDYEEITYDDGHISVLRLDYEVES